MLIYYNIFFKEAFTKKEFTEENKKQKPENHKGKMKSQNRL